MPVKALFEQTALSWQSVYHHYRKWCRAGFWKECWIKLLDRHRTSLDLSNVDLDGSHTPAKRGDENVEYQGRKKCKTTNSLYLSDRQGIPLAISEPVAGDHNDLYDIEVQFEVVTATLKEADIPVARLFLNADAGFDSKDFRKSCDKMEINANICFNKRNGDADRNEYFDKTLYNQRYAIERTNAWMDSYRSLLNRFDTTTDSWGTQLSGVHHDSTYKIRKEKEENSLNHFTNNTNPLHLACLKTFYQILKFSFIGHPYLLA